MKTPTAAAVIDAIMLSSRMQESFWEFYERIGRRAKVFLRSLITTVLLAIIASCAQGATSPWKGGWIWSQTPREDNYFRKAIEVKADPAQAKLAITADNIYELYVNDTKIASDSDWTNLEVYDLSKHLGKGCNIIAIKAIDPGADLGGLLVELAIAYADGDVDVVGSDAQWKISGSAADGWTTADFDDSGWETPREIGPPPVGPWGGIDHPALAPRSPMEMVAVYWPKKAAPGDVVDVTCKVRLLRKAVADSPVGLRVLSKGEAVFEHWMDPETPVTQWQPQEVRTIKFTGVRIPIYCPLGVLQAQVVTTATDTIGGPNIRIGPAPQPRKIPSVTVLNPAAKVVDEKRRLKIYAVYKGDVGEKVMFSLFDGDRMMFATDIKPGAQYVDLPETLPGGTYTARFLPHKAICTVTTDVRVAIPGPANPEWKPYGWGTFTDRDGICHRWYINRQGALIWDGSPYIPVGAMYLSRWFMDYNTGSIDHNELTWKDDIKRLRAMKEAGITDLYLNPCRNWDEKPAWVWQRFAELCEEMGFNYGIQVTNHMQPLKAYHIAQDEYLVSANGGDTVEVEISGTYNGRTDPENAVLYAAFDVETGKLLDSGRALVEKSANGIRAQAQPRVEAGKAISVHFIPEFTFFGDMHDYWTAYDDSYTRRIDEFFSSLELGPNFRLWIDPLDNEQSFRDMHRMLPHSPRFRAMFADYLRQKYVRPDKVMEAWAIQGAEKINMDGLARLVPLGKPSASADMGYALDEQTGRTFEIDLTKSTMWFDMLRFRDSSIAEFNNRIADDIKKHHNAPVVLKATDTDCFVNSRSVGGFDGLGMEAYGAAPELVRGCGGGVYSRCKQANRTMWTLVTETGLAEEPVGYPDPQRLVKELGSMVEMNAKGTFYFLLAAAGGRPGEGWYIFNLFEDPRQLHWMGMFSKMMKSAAALPEYEPGVDYYFPGAIAGQKDSFTRREPDFHSDIPSQSVACDSGRWAVTTSTRIPADAGKVIVNLEDMPATAIHGPAFEEALKTREVVVVGHRRDRGALSIDNYYTDRFVTLENGTTVQALSPTPSSHVFAKTEDGTVFGLTDGRLTLYSHSDWINSVRKMAAKPDGVDFYSDVLGLKVLDLGRAFQGLHFGSTTYLWNLTSEERVLTLEAPTGANRATVTFPDGVRRAVNGHKSMSLRLPANAEAPVIIEGLTDVKLSGVDTANLAAAMQHWAKAQKRAKELGIEASIAPPSSDWREIYRMADDLTRRAEDAYRTTAAARMESVTVDGDLTEWKDADPIYLKMDVGIDYAKSADYAGARFYTGYDDNFLYISGDVTDEAIVNNYRLGGIWNGDAIEVFIDLYPDAQPGMRNYNENCFQFLFSPTNLDGKPEMIVKNPLLPPDTVPGATRWAVKKSDMGWQFEAAIGRMDLNGYSFEPGKVIGFTIQLDDSDGGDRTSAKLWRGTKNASRDRLGFGRMIFE